MRNYYEDSYLNWVKTVYTDNDDNDNRQSDNYTPTYPIYVPDNLEFPRLTGNTNVSESDIYTSEY
jgi:hypothetical protein